MITDRTSELEYFQPRAAEEERGAARVLPPALADWARRAECYITAHPGLALGAGLCVGVMLGWLIKRR